MNVNDETARAWAELKAKGRRALGQEGFAAFLAFAAKQEAIIAARQREPIDADRVR